MIAVAWALASALLYGISDYLSGVQSRVRSYLWVGFTAQVVSGACALAVAILSGGAPSSGALAWGALASLGGAVGTLSLMRGLASGAMHVAGPISAAFGAGIPVVVGIACGERPGLLAVGGILLALPAIWLVASGDAGDGSGGVRDGLLAGLGFGLFFTALAHAGEGAWPVAVTQVLSAWVMGCIVVAARPSGSLRSALPAWQVGLTGFLASYAYVRAAAAGLLTVVSVITSLYPAVTVLLAMTLLAERATRVQLLGLGLSAVAVTAIAIG